MMSPLMWEAQVIFKAIQEVMTETALEKSREQGQGAVRASLMIGTQNIHVHLAEANLYTGLRSSILCSL